METIGEFLAMGGYAAYVWSSYALAAAVMAGLWLAAGQRKRNSRRRIAEGQQEQ